VIDAARGGGQDAGRSETLMNPDIDLKVFWQPG
jgi:hypothetical protein